MAGALEQDYITKSQTALFRGGPNIRCRYRGRLAALCTQFPNTYAPSAKVEVICDASLYSKVL